jgi:hypothetical protein
VRFVVDEAALRQCFILGTICCSYQQKEINIYKKKKKKNIGNAFGNLRTAARIIYIRYLSQRRPDILFIYLHAQTAAGLRGK